MELGSASFAKDDTIPCLGEFVACRAIGARIRRAGWAPIGRAPGDQMGERVPTRMIGAETLREERPHGDQRGIEPTVPFLSGGTQRNVDTIFRQEGRKDEMGLSPRHFDRRAKLPYNLGLLAR